MIDLGKICLLKTEVEKRFGRMILSSADCQSLCDDISRNSSAKLSFNTIRRCFNLMKADSQPSLYTLNALSTYCGYSSFDDFVKASQHSSSKALHKNDHVVLSFLTLFFKQIEVSKRNDHTYLSFVQQTILHLEHYPSIIDVFQREIAKTKNGQIFYFEQFVFVDKLNSYYGTGLQYYLNEKKSPDGQLFGNALLCFLGWLRNNREMVESHYKSAMLIGIEKTIAPSAGARYFAMRLFYADICNMPKEQIQSSARQFYLSRMQPEDNTSGLNSFEVVLAAALVLTGCYEEASFYIEEVLNKVKKNIPTFIDVALLESVNVLKAVVLAHTRNKLKALSVLHDINPSNFSFLSRQFMGILYLLIKQMLKANFDEHKQLDHLIEETGFIRLRSVWKNRTQISDKHEEHLL